MQQIAGWLEKFGLGQYAENRAPNSLTTRLWQLVHWDHAPEREINAAQGIEAANCTLEEKARGVRRSFLIRAHMMKAKIEERERRKIILNCHVLHRSSTWSSSQEPV
jgi:hypothetical protein